MSPILALGIWMLALGGVGPVGASHAGNSDLQTHAERTEFVETGRYPEAARLCRAFAAAFPARAVCRQWGVSAEGRPLLALIVGKEARANGQKRKLPVVFAQAGIHAGEIDGKDAGFLIVREILEGKRLKGILEKLTFVFVPILNVDGHERFGPNHRPNQNGPAQMGWRVNAQNLNLNRDYLKVESIELRQLQPLWWEYHPILSLDLHVTDGADFGNRVGLVVAPSLPDAQPELGELARVGEGLRKTAVSRLSALGVAAVDFYPSFKTEEDPKSGFEQDIAGPRFSQGYWSAAGRLGILVETHSWKSYAMRVHDTHRVLELFLELAASNGLQWEKLARAQRERMQKAPWPRSFGIEFKPGTQTRMIDFPGYAYTVENSDVSGGKWIRYDSSRPEIWRVPLVENVEVKKRVELPDPSGGYWVEAGFASLVAPILKVHGIKYSKVVERKGRTVLGKFGLGQRSGGCEEAEGTGGKVGNGERVAAASSKPSVLRLKGYRAQAVEWPKKSYEGRQGVKLTGAYEDRERRVQVGDLFVPWAQPQIRLIVALFEAESRDSLGAWGFFNARLEQREYMEAYVAEAEARKMLAKDAALKRTFEARLKSDPGFAASPSDRLDFFYQRHPAWDELVGLLPVYRVESANALESVTPQSELIREKGDSRSGPRGETGCWVLEGQK